MKVSKWKLFSLCILLTLTIGSYGQDSAERVSKVLFELKDLHEVGGSTIQSVVGEYVVSDGFGGYTYYISRNGSFKRRDFGCLDNSVSDSGVYKLRENSQLQLISKNKKSKFIVYRFDKFFFLIPATKTEEFKKAFISYAKQYYNAEPVKLQDERYTDQFFIAFSLMKTYLTKLD